MATTRRRARKQSYFDYSMLILIIFIVAFGLVMIYSASSYRAQMNPKFNNDAAYFLKKQGIAAILGIIVMLIVSKIDYRFYIKPMPVVRIVPIYALYFLSIFLQTIVLFIGNDVNGSKRWLSFGPLSFQPCEITKIALLLFVSYIIYRKPGSVDTLKGIFRIGVYMLPPILLVMKENLSSAIILVAIVMGICFIASRKKWIYILVALIGAAGATAYIFLGEGFRAARVDMWLNIEDYADKSQVLQGMYAMASGGMFGTGLGQSMQKLGRIPEAHNDMIFTVVCEELGVVGAIVVVLLFVLLIWRIFIVAINAPDLYGGLICTGIMVQIAVQVILNIAVVTNTIPATGVSLPFISYGGTSITILLAEMGIALSASSRIESR